tara:strand:+ start:661 stop:1401 length:741 start_codon:yes stop_codon:yes gene_type:complete
MNIWGKLLGSTGGFALGGPLGALLGVIAGHAIDKIKNKKLPEQMVVKQVGFTIGVIALSAKMAKADGKVTREEILSFKRQVTIPKKEINNLGKIWNLAKKSTAGYEIYASQLAKLFEPKSQVLEQLIFVLYNIAMSDGKITIEEMSYLENVSNIFGFNENDFNRIRYHYEENMSDPYKTLGVEPHTNIREIKNKWIKMSKEIHPDKLLASGVPEEFINKNTKKLQDINNAWEKIKKEKNNSNFLQS